ncbi:nicotinate-nucleotide--dimethylbenzimidazole phosphoribosyltransferase [Streptomyces sp. NPDC059009]|uniref:nicotinate-nucleotide--dimethylbenzimidazole phosphoribosyltransferase n=1 Tax=Streptomyces sp. NPDC059009 TaxID=3346694 RepID=UPI00367E40D5
MTDTGQVPAEGLPENAGGAAPGPVEGPGAQQPGVPAPGAYTFLDPSETAADDDDLLLMPGAQGAWSEAQAQAVQAQTAPAHAAPAHAAPAPQGLQPQPAHQPGPHETAGRDSGSVDLNGVQMPGTQATPPAGHGGPARRPLHRGPATPGPGVPDGAGSPVRSLADRGPAAGTSQHAVPVRQAGPPTTGPEYFDIPRDEAAPLPGPQLGEIPPQGLTPWAAQPQTPAGQPQSHAEPQVQFALQETPAETVVPEGAPAPEAPVAPMAAHATPVTPSTPAPQQPEQPAIPEPTAPEYAQAQAHAQAQVQPQPQPQAQTPAQSPEFQPVPPAEPAQQWVDAPQAHAAAPLGQFVPVEGSVPTTPHLAPTPPRPVAVPPEYLEPEQSQEPQDPQQQPEPQQPQELQQFQEPQQPQAVEPSEPEVRQEVPQEAPAPEAPVEAAAPEATPEPAPAPEPETAAPEAVAPEAPQPEPLAPEPASGEPAPTVPAPRDGGPAAEATPAQSAPVEAVVVAEEPEPTATAPEATTPEATEPRQEAEPVAEPVQELAQEPVQAAVQEAPAPTAQPEAAEAAEATEAVEAVESETAEPLPADAAPPLPEPSTELTAQAQVQDQDRPVSESASAEPVTDQAPAAGPAPEPPAPEQQAPEHLAPEELAPEEPASDQPTAEPTGTPAPGYDEAEREAVLRVMRERRDIRNGFRSDAIPHEVLLRVLEAAHTAPSVGHSQPWDFVVIRSAETRRTMHELAMRQKDAYAKSLPKGRAKQFKELKIEAILDTPVNIVVTADPTRGGRHTLGRHTQPQMAPYSSALAVENLWLAARAEGLGVGWVSFFDEREMVRTLGLPEHLEVVAYLCVGYVDEFPDEPELMQAGWSKRRPLSWVVHEETYGRRALPGEEPHDLLAETVASIRPLDAKALGEAWERQKRMTKPAGALGMLEIISAQLSGLSRMCPPPIPEPAAVAIFAGDHGVHAQGVTPWPQEVTGQMVANFLGGGAVCNAFASQVGAEVCVIDVGVASELPATPGLLPRKIRPGTADMTTGPALSREEVKAAIEVGIETARDLVAAGNKALLTGEMGIANTTASAALISVYTDTDPAEVTGRGTGINDETHARKIEVVRRALDLHQPDPADPIGVLAAIGGLEHAAMVGLLLGGASLRTPVILDGVSAGAAALVARAIAPEVLAASIAGHRSAEPGHVAALNKLGLRPLIDLDLRLGEGTGALLALPVVQSAARAMHEVATFDSAGVTEK